MLLNFTTKAAMLVRLKKNLRSAQIAPIVVFTVADWLTDRTACLGKVTSTLADGPWIVRSSCSREDNSVGSNAGAFLTLKDVTVIDLEISIEKVIASYGDTIVTDEVLIQPMLKDVIRSGRHVLS